MGGWACGTGAVTGGSKFIFILLSRSNVTFLSIVAYAEQADWNMVSVLVYLQLLYLTTFGPPVFFPGEG